MGRAEREPARCPVRCTPAPEDANDVSLPSFRGVKGANQINLAALRPALIRISLGWTWGDGYYILFWQEKNFSATKFFSRPSGWITRAAPCWR